ncbi:hypothetical protein NEUTE1DRAFT_90027 [Neurospora tetrasperma FGSC 2508]|uniref:N-acetyltransferase domain-containing protein n=1 Tax=Neurospora tetrasperma (strain FGSC 2508 / ATCC MYA-4615 / P0657) TaxID=510951 RepID=F8N067_NEUT8|nr:uncharacterized protein NEUTE1DRAFT_90027 [Neurospora tetrasperma FGSC 2508]EGO52098.1 hypothetical protein NEUTE1DRAFT_90027 [Neurospora tetrasperma FGSC 2508]
MTVALNPRIRVREAVPADAEAITNILNDAFSANPMQQLMYPNGVSDASRSKSAARLFLPIPPSEGETFMVVPELLPEGSDGPCEIVAFSDWCLFRNPRAEEEWNVQEVPRTQEQLGEDCDVRVFNEFIGGLHRKRREHMKGDPGLVLSTLVCQTNRQRLGAGKALLHWGTTLADELGLPLFLESSPTAYNLYKQFGFEDIDVFDLPIFDLFGASKRQGQDWGEHTALELAGPPAKGCFRSTIMRRPAKST